MIGSSLRRKLAYTRYRKKLEEGKKIVVLTTNRTEEIGDLIEMAEQLGYQLTNQTESSGHWLVKNYTLYFKKGE